MCSMLGIFVYTSRCGGGCGKAEVIAATTPPPPRVLFTSDSKREPGKAGALEGALALVLLVVYGTLLCGGCVAGCMPKRQEVCMRSSCRDVGFAAADMCKSDVTRTRAFTQGCLRPWVLKWDCWIRTGAG